MKTVMMIMCMALVCACTSKEAKAYYTTVMLDLTEEDAYRPQADVVKPHAALPERKAGKYFSILPINDLAHNMHNGVMITRADVGISYDEMSRKLVVDDYTRKVDSLLHNLDSLQYGTDHSKIFRAIVTEARFLMKQDCDVRKIVCYSDLEENSDFFSLRNRAHRKMMDDPEAMVKYFETQYNLEEDESFDGLIIEIYHVPGYETERSFDVFLQLYSDIFESHGATVSHELSIITQVEL